MRRGALGARCALISLVAALSLVAGCGKPDIVGQWEKLSPQTKRPLGDVMTVEKGGKWHATGFPAMEGTYEWRADAVHFTIQKLGDMTRQQAIDSMKGKSDVEAQISKLEEQYTFNVVEEDGSTYLEQQAKVGGFSPLLFRRKSK